MITVHILSPHLNFRIWFRISQAPPLLPGKERVGGYIYLKNRRLNFNAEIAKLKSVGCKILRDSSWSQTHLCGIVFAFVGDFQWSRLIVSLACLSQDWPQKYFLPPRTCVQACTCTLGTHSLQTLNDIEWGGSKSVLPGTHSLLYSSARFWFCWDCKPTPPSAPPMPSREWAG